jgi:hypothetical protein
VSRTFGPLEIRSTRTMKILICGCNRVRPSAPWLSPSPPHILIQRQLPANWKSAMTVDHTSLSRGSLSHMVAPIRAADNENATSTLTIISLDLLTSDQGELSLPSHRRPNTLSLP